MARSKSREVQCSASLEEEGTSSDDWISMIFWYSYKSECRLVANSCHCSERHNFVCSTTMCSVFILVAVFIFSYFPVSSFFECWGLKQSQKQPNWWEPTCRKHSHLGSLSIVVCLTSWKCRSQLSRLRVVISTSSIFYRAWLHACFIDWYNTAEKQFSKTIRLLCLWIHPVFWGARRHCVRSVVSPWVAS